LGSIRDATFSNGLVSSTLNAKSILGVANVSATVDDEIVNTLVNIITLNVNSTNPILNANNVPTTQVITITFSDPIQASVTYNYINVKNAAGLAAGIKTAYINNILTITSNYGWVPGTTYTINLPAYSIVSTIGAQLMSVYTSTFTTAALPPSPTVTSVVPTTGAISVPTTQVITITFSNPIEAGNVYNNINVKNAAGVAAGITKTINGNTLTITANNGWTTGTTYTINLPANCVVNSGSPLTTTYTSTFTTATPPPNPTVTSINPTNGTTKIPTNQIITITFSNPIEAGNVYNNINIKNAAGVSVGITKTISGNTLTITANNGWTTGTTYSINIPANSINSTSGAPLTTAYTSTFST
jgi:methionine-rich copper-binding protein CopC